MGPGVGISLAFWRTNHHAATHITLLADTNQEIANLDETIADLDRKVEGLIESAMDIQKSQNEIIQLLERHFSAQLDTQSTRDETGN